MPEPPHIISVPLAWIGLEEAPVVHANQLIAQIGYDRQEIYLTIGSATPPIVLGSEDEQREAASRLPFVPVRTITRLVVSRSKLDEIVGILQDIQTKAAELDRRSQE